MHLTFYKRRFYEETNPHILPVWPPQSTAALPRPGSSRQKACGGPQQAANPAGVKKAQPKNSRSMLAGGTASTSSGRQRLNRPARSLRVSLLGFSGGSAPASELMSGASTQIS